MRNYFLYRILRGVLVLFALSCLGTASVSAQETSSYEITPSEEILWFKANEERAQRGIAPLELAGDASRLARRYSAAMAQKGKIAHRDSQGRGPGHRLVAGNVLVTSYSENVAFHQSAPEAHNAFMNSPGHKVNLLNPEQTEMGVGIVADAQGNIYVTELFFSRLPYTEEEAVNNIQLMTIRLRSQSGISPLFWDPKLASYIGEALQARTADASLRSLPVPEYLSGRLTATSAFSSVTLAPPSGTSKIITDPQLTHLGASIAVGERTNMTHYYRVHMIVYGK